MTNPDEIKDMFYEELDSFMASVPQSEKLIIHGDFNARVGTDHQAWDRIIGKHGANHDRVEEKWASFRDALHSAALETLGPATRHHQDWFDENDSEIHALLEDKRRLLRAHQNDPSSMAKKAAFTNMRNTVQAKLCSIADGSTLLTDKKQILERWAKHFGSVLNRPAVINDEAIARLPQVAINTELDAQPSYEEVNKAIKQMTTGKAPGPDAIPAEVYKTGGETIRNQLTSLFQSMWKQEHMPQEFRDATIVHIYKRKENRQSCDNHRGISLLSIAGKILARVLLNRLLEHLEQGLLSESQCGFRAGRGTTDMIFAARQLREKCMEQHRDLYTTFVDLTKAFDTVSRGGLWRIMKKIGCPSTFIAIVRQLHDGMMARVLDDGEPSEAFPVINGVKQGCVLAPTLFSMMFSAMLSDAFSDGKPGINITYRSDGKLFNPWRLQAVTKVKETVLRDFLFADDCALNAGDEQEMQAEMDSLSSACNNFGFTISTKKTEVMYQPVPNKQYHEPQITVNGQTLQAVETFTYLGSTLSRNANIDTETNNRISKASSAFGRLREKVWERRGISLKTKLKVYHAVVLTTLLYGCETWTVYRRHEKQLNHFHLRCLRNILHIRWQDKVPDTEVLKQTDIPSAITIMRKAQLNMGRPRLPYARQPHSKAARLRGTLCGKCTAGGQRKRFKDSLKVSLLGIACLRQAILAPPHHQRSLHSRGTQIPSSRAETCNSQIQSHQHHNHDP
ncbi:hypothetical protein ACOMHN_063504 [Nucella lapillus]